MTQLSETQVKALRLAAIGGDISWRFRNPTKDSLHWRDLTDGDYQITERGLAVLRRLGHLPIAYYVNVSYSMKSYWNHEADVDREFKDLVEDSLGGFAFESGTGAAGGRRDLGYIVEKSLLQHFKALARDYFKQARIPIRINSWRFNPEA